MSLIEVKNITKRFNDKIALDNISFSVNEGEFFGLIGPNGAGKSTLISIMTNLMLPNNGCIEVNNMDLSKNPIEIKSLMGLVPQELAIIEHLSPYDNLEYFGALYGLSGKLLKERIAEALEIAGLTEVKRKKVKKLSGGMKRRLNIVMAMLHHPKILILDEPTAGLDPKGRDDILEQIKILHDEYKMTIVLVSHSMEDVGKLAERVIVMNKGSVALEGTPAEVFKEIDKLEEIGLAVPQVTYLMRALKEKGFNVSEEIFTIEQGKRELLKVLKTVKE